MTNGGLSGLSRVIKGYQGLPQSVLQDLAPHTSQSLYTPVSLHVLRKLLCPVEGLMPYLCKCMHIYIYIHHIELIRAILTGLSWLLGL